MRNTIKSAAILLLLGFASVTMAVETAIFQEGLSDADGANTTYEMDFTGMTSSCGHCMHTVAVVANMVGLNGASVNRLMMRWDVTSLQGKVRYRAWVESLCSLDYPSKW